MKNNLSNIKKAIKYLNKNQCVGIPTETVYGLAANAYSSAATNKIFKLKKRPQKNPLIVHYYDLKFLKKDCVINKHFLKLYRKYSPGPISYILKLKKNSLISKNVTNKKKTLAVRFPSHPITRNLLKKLNYPLAAPSANISTKISPVSKKDVQDEFGKKITPFPGATEFLTQINESLAKEHDISVEGYVVSCGIESLMQGTILSESFTDIFGSSFYEENGMITGVKSSITFTEKTKFVYAINKGVSDIREEPYNVNTFAEEEKRRIPFENMIYLGDGASDIPCFSMIKNLGGHCIGIDIDSQWHKEFQLELRKREMAAFKPDYREGSELYNNLRFLIGKIILN